MGGVVRGFNSSTGLFAVEVPSEGASLNLEPSAFVQRLRVELSENSFASTDAGEGTIAEVVGVEQARDGGADAYVLQLAEGRREVRPPHRLRLLNGVVVRVATRGGSERLRRLDGKYGRVRGFVPPECRYIVDVAGVDGPLR